ncbi:MAG: beta-ketoacyl-[acyl-carrier-protein] synthase family protein [Spartobacteria bacterium]|nr:beta-ketoacyl-[acyl-carrier-protein] synthase family protein [Spartobacteria bacterium]
MKCESRIFVTGMGLITSLGSSVDKNWKQLLAEKTGVREARRFDGSRYDGAPLCSVDIPSLEGDDPYLDDASRILFVAVQEALGGRTDLASAPLYLATTMGGMAQGLQFYKDYQKHGITKNNLRHLKDYVPYMQGIHLSRRMGFRRAPLVISNACSSGGNAVGMAWMALKAGMADKAIVAGYDIVCEFVFGGFNVLRLISRSGCRPFDKHRDGLVLGEGAAVLVLETEASARASGRTLLAEVSGYAASCDAYHCTQPHPEGDGAEKVIRDCLSSAHLQPGDISYVNAHGTATLHNDMMEAKAVQRVFKDNPSMFMTSTKASTGHTLGAAGVIESVFSVLSLRDQVVPPTLGIHDPIEELGHVTVPSTATTYDVRHVISTSYGFGGTNACVAFSKAGV